MDQYIVSARKYRPATFDMVVGQTSITNTLKNAIRNNTLAQAFLFTGPRGVGKTTCARILAKTINCLNPTPNLDPCDQCESCVSFRQSTSFNIHELDAASNNSVNDIRNLVEQVRIPPQVGKYKIYIIDEVHMLSSEAFNAFLKTLEEPPSYAKFILATTEKHKIIPTILSRCQIYDFKRITVEDISKHIAYVAEKEGVNIDEDARNIIAMKADGALRDALSIFDQMVSFSGHIITYHDVIRNLNILDYDYYFRMVDHLLNADVSSIMLMLNEVIYTGFDPQHFMNGLASHLRNLLVAARPETLPLLEVSESLRARYREQSAVCQSSFLLAALEVSNECDVNYARSSNKRLLVELTLLRMAGAAPKMQPNNENPAAYATAGNTALHSKNSANPAQIAQSEPTVKAAPSTKPVVPPTAASQSIPPRTTTTQAQQSTAYTDNQLKAKTSPPHSEHTISSAYSPERPVRTVNEPKQNIPQGARTISISNKVQQAKSESDQKPIWNNPFTQEDLSNAWADFCAHYDAVSPAFVNAIRRLKPELGENWNIKVKMDSKFPVFDKLNWIALQDYLFKHLGNNQLKLIPEFQETPMAQHVPYTDREKFHQMMIDYPYLRQLSEELGLEADS